MNPKLNAELVDTGNPTGEERERIIENILKDLDVDDPEDGKRAASTAWSHDSESSEVRVEF